MALLLVLLNIVHVDTMKALLLHRLLWKLSFGDITLSQILIVIKFAAMVTSLVRNSGARSHWHTVNLPGVSSSWLSSLQVLSRTNSHILLLLTLHVSSSTKLNLLILKKFLNEWLIFLSLESKVVLDWTLHSLLATWLAQFPTSLTKWVLSIYVVIGLLMLV